VAEQLAQYTKSFAEGGAKLENAQLVPRIELMQKILKLWPKQTGEWPMSTAVSKMMEQWKSTGLMARPGCSPTAIMQFETRSGHVLPRDLREFLLAANGIEKDSNGFAFWPVEAYESASRQVALRSPTAPLVENPGDYFVFCDYLDWSWAYAIRLNNSAEESTTTNRIVPVGMNQVFTVCDSFSDFVGLYLRDSQRLYPP
jgi:hypothetical protein